MVAQIAFFRSFGPSKRYVVLKTKSIFFGIKVFYTELLNFLQLLGDKFCEKKRKNALSPQITVNLSIKYRPKATFLAVLGHHFRKKATFSAHYTQGNVQTLWQHPSQRAPI